MKLIELRNELEIQGLYTLMYQEKDTNFIFKGEVHDFWELIYMDKGFAYLLIEDKGYKINQGDLFLLNKNQNHIVWADNRVAPCFLTISFELKFWDDKYFEYKRFKVNTELKEIIRKILNERINLFEGEINENVKAKRDNRAASEQLIKIYISELMLKLYKLGKNYETSAASSTIKQKSENMLVEKCISFMDEHINEKISLEQVCRYIPISQSYLSKIFKVHTGRSIKEYYMETKLEKAKSLIRESGLSLTEISNLLDFSSLHHFSRAFKHKFMISPSEYAKSIKSII